MYYIGIDISKFKHDCAVIDDAGDVVTPSWSFANDLEGFLQFKALLDSLGTETKIGLESTGHYGMNLKLFLEADGFSFMEFNPLLINRFVKSKSLRKTKTDAIDCEMIARYLMTVEYKPYPPSFYHIEKLKSLTRFRDNLVRQRSRQLVELTNILDKVFPEFKPFFGGKFTVTALHILSEYSSSEKIANMNSRSYEPLRKLSRGRFSTTHFAIGFYPLVGFVQIISVQHLFKQVCTVLSVNLSTFGTARFCILFVFHTIHLQEAAVSGVFCFHHTDLL